MRIREKLLEILRERYEIVFCFFFLKIYLFIWLRRVFIAALGLLSSCGARAPECEGSVVAACRLSSCGPQV